MKEKETHLIYVTIAISHFPGLANNIIKNFFNESSEKVNEF